MQLMITITSFIQRQDCYQNLIHKPLERITDTMKCISYRYNTYISIRHIVIFGHLFRGTHQGVVHTFTTWFQLSQVMESKEYYMRRKQTQFGRLHNAAYSVIALQTDRERILHRNNTFNMQTLYSLIEKRILFARYRNMEFTDNKHPA